MKLWEIFKTGGTYVAVVPSLSTIGLLKQWAVKAQVALDENLHVTVLYSRVPIMVQPSSAEYSAEAKGLAKYGNCLVLELECPPLSTRHETLIRKGGTHDFPSYKPHLTLQSDSNIEINSLPPVDFRIALVNEYSEPIDLD